MKFNLTLLSEKSRKAYVLFGLLSGAVFFNSCKDSDPQPRPAQAAFAVINASSSKPSVDFYLDNQKLPLNTPLSYGNASRYFLVTPPGNKTGKVTVSGNTTSIGTGKFELENDRYHSIFITNSGDTTSLLRVRDDWAQARTGYAQIRFINLSPDAPKYSLEYAGDTTAFSNKAFKEYTGFKYVTAKAGITLNLKNAVTNEVVATLPNVDLKSGIIYTVWAKGLASQLPTDTAKRIKVTRIEPFQ
jgi:hypothetical protein